MSLTDEQIDRYSRQIILPEVGGRGQERLLAARVLVAGDDAAADAAVTLLGRAGGGTLDLAGGTAASSARAARDPSRASEARARRPRGPSRPERPARTQRRAAPLARPRAARRRLGRRTGRRTADRGLALPAPRRRQAPLSRAPRP